MSESFKKSLPKMKAGWSPSKILTPPRVRRIQKTFYNLQVTIICGFVTILVLRGTLGAGRYGTPGKDFFEITNHLPGSKERTTRTMMEFRSTESEQENSERNKRSLADKKFDPVKYFDPNTVHHTLGEPISDWDEQREAYMLKNKGANKTTGGRPRILLVSGSQPNPCDNPLGDYLLLKNLKNKVDYCRLHDIEIFYNMAHLDLEMSGFWAKLPLLRKLMLSHPDLEWIWWMDSDAFFTDMLFELPMEQYTDYNMVLHGWYDLVYKKKSWTGLNTGSFLIRNCQWSLDLLDAWAPYGPKGNARNEAGKIMTKYLDGRPEFEADDQSALIYLLLSQKEKWADKAYLESSYFLHGYWVILVDNYEKMMEKYHPGLGDERWPFVTHFVGCKPCHGKTGDYSTERCTTQMERAFNFADNQILQIYGYKHPNLESLSVEKVKASADEDQNETKQLRGHKPRITG